MVETWYAYLLDILRSNDRKDFDCCGECDVVVDVLAGKNSRVDESPHCNRKVGAFTLNILDIPCFIDEYKSLSLFNKLLSSQNGFTTRLDTCICILQLLSALMRLEPQIPNTTCRSTESDQPT